MKKNNYRGLLYASLLFLIGLSTIGVSATETVLPTLSAQVEQVQPQEVAPAEEVLKLLELPNQETPTHPTDSPPLASQTTNSNSVNQVETSYVSEILEDRALSSFGEGEPTDTGNPPTETSQTFTIEDYKQASASELARAIRDNRVTSEELVNYAFQVIEETNPDLNNIISLQKEEALKAARELQDTGQPFYGVPMLMKGMGGHAIKGGLNSNGLTFMADTVSSSDGSFSRSMKEAGFILIGQTSYPQYGWINVTNSDLYGVTHNPWNLDHNPGGSSGGSSAAVSAGQTPMASASDAGGSIRIPASWSSLIGYMPSRGILKNSSAAETNQTGNFALTKTMEDTQTLFDALLKPNSGVADVALSKETKIAYSLATPAGTPLDPEATKAVMSAVDWLKEQGYQVEEVAYPVDGEAMMRDYYTIAAGNAGGLDLMARRALQRPLEKGDVELLTWALYQTSKKLTRADIIAAWQNIRAYRQRLDEFYAQYPILLTPTTAFPAPVADYNHIPDELKDQMADMSQLSKEDSLKLIYDQWLPAWTLTPYTQLSNLTGTPSISLPTHLTADKLPLGIMFSTNQYQDKYLMDLGRLFEEADKFWILTDYGKIEEKIPDDAPTEDEKPIATIRQERREDITQLAFSLVELPDANLLVGERELVQPGVNGRLIKVYEDSYLGDELVGSRFVDVLTELPVVAIFRVGTKEVVLAPRLVSREDKQVLTFSILHLPDSSLPVGERELVQSGADGYELKIYEDTYQGDELISSRLVETKLVQPVPAIFRVGTKESAPAIRQEKLMEIKGQVQAEAIVLEQDGQFSGGPIVAPGSVPSLPKTGSQRDHLSLIGAVCVLAGSMVLGWSAVLFRGDKPSSC